MTAILLLSFVMAQPPARDADAIAIMRMRLALAQQPTKAALPNMEAAKATAGDRPLVVFVACSPLPVPDGYAVAHEPQTWGSVPRGVLVGRRIGGEWYSVTLAATATPGEMRLAVQGIENRLRTSQQPYTSPSGYHRHVTRDGTVIEHHDSNHGSAPAHADILPPWPKYFGPLAPAIRR